MMLIMMLTFSRSGSRIVACSQSIHAALPACLPHTAPDTSQSPHDLSIRKVSHV